MPTLRQSLPAFRHAAFRRLWLASTVSLLGDWLGFVAVSVLALEHGGGPLVLVGVLAAHALPHALVAPLAGALVDRYDRRRILVIANVLQAALTFLAALAATRAEVVLVQVLVLLRGAVGALVVPAETAAVRRTVPAEELLGANTILATTWSIAYVVGMALGGLLAELGAAPAIALDGASFLLAAGLVRLLPPLRPDRPAGEVVVGVQRVLRAVPADLVAAWRHAWRELPLLRAVLGKMPTMAAGGAGWLVMNLIAAGAPLGTAALSLGLFQAVRGAGTGLGPLVAARLVNRGLDPWRVWSGAVWLTFFAVGVFALHPAPAVLLGLALLWGCGSGTTWVLTATGMQRLAPDYLVGRLSAIDELAAIAAQITGALAAAAVVEWTGRGALAVAAGIGLGLVAWLALRREGAVATAPTAPQAVVSVTPPESTGT